MKQQNEYASFIVMCGLAYFAKFVESSKILWNWHPHFPLQDLFVIDISF